MQYIDILKYSKIRDVKSPSIGSEHSVGIDVFIPDEFGSIVFPPKRSIMVPTGLKFNIPHGYALIFYNKSGIAAKKNLILGACVIDSDYQGEVVVNLHNIGEHPVTLSAGDPISQLLIKQVIKMNLVEEEDPSKLYTETTQRGEGGFGSTFQVKG
jgi:dUTP pyrophosphatase